MIDAFPRSSGRRPGLAMSIFNVSKGVDCYTYLGDAYDMNEIVITLSVPGQSPVSIEADGFQPYPNPINLPLPAPQNLQVNSSNLSGFFDLYGAFSWQATDMTGNGSVPLAANSVSINPYTGNAAGTVADMFNTTSFIVPVASATSATGNTVPLAVSYGFYDAGSGQAGLPSQDQFWLYITQSLQTWMTDNARALNSIPLAHMCLPGAHDAGMCTMQSVYQMMDSIEGVAFEAVVGLIVSAITSQLVGPVSPLFGAYAALNIDTVICNFSMTQKDSIAGMLASGIRYFDFRPGYMWSSLPSLGGALYHQHKCIPGYGYVNFLTDVLSFCAQNPGEIVVINLNDSGFADLGNMSPSDGELNAAWSSACALATSDPSSPTPTGVYNIAPVGGKDALGATYHQLVTGLISNDANQQGTPITSNQIVFLYQMTNATGAPNNVFTTTKWDSYSDPVYATTDPTPIRAVFAQMATQQNQDDYTVLQCQGTCTNLPGVMLDTAITSSAAGSPLLATKAAFDNCNLGWIADNVARHAVFTGQLLVLLNDFADNATTITALQVNTRIPGFSVP